ncbi:MAG: T9SS type A sorting domain-containing protein, partial [Bacteroidia bacterium]|nr:T9SS type A sorting domain-containing protein [Bacteroidia bacterium]
NNDNKLDFISGKDINTINIFIGNGVGSFTTNTNYLIGTPFNISSADLNNDSKIDIASINSNTVNVIFGNGLGGVTGSTNIPIGVSNPAKDIITKDINGDNKADIATLNPFNSNITLLINNGAGGFMAGQNISTGSTDQNAAAFIAEDFNNDGVLDFAITDQSAGKTKILLSNFSYTISTTPVTCNGGSTGSASVTISCGAAPYTYTWTTSPIQTTSTATNLSAGTYTLFIKNNAGKTFTTTTTITQPPPLNATITQTNVACSNTSGTASLSVTGGTAPYFYTWSSGTVQNPPTKVTNLAPGIHTVTVKDMKNCTKIITFTITSPPPINIAVSVTQPICFSSDIIANSTGTATLTITGGTSPYSLDWSLFPISSNTISNIPDGSHLLDVTDANNCVKTTTINIISPPDLSGVFSTTNISCYGSNDGKASVLMNSGTAPYSYYWNNSSIASNSIISGLPPGNCNVKVVDAKMCNGYYGNSIYEPLQLVPEVISVSNSNCSGNCTGSITGYAHNGTPPYNFSFLPNTVHQIGNNADQLCPGNYTFVVTDTNGCVEKVVVPVGTNNVINPNVYLTNLAAIDQINISPSFAAYYSYNLPASITPPPSNPRNFVDPGKKARFKVECTNQKSNGLSVVSGICKVRSNNPFITITDSSSALNNVGWNGTKWSADEFEIDIAPNTPAGTNAYIDFVVQESGQDYKTTCIAIPITPLVYSPTTPSTIDDDNNPDSQGNNDDICNPGETIEFYPLLDNVSNLNAEYVRGRFENLNNLSYINIWNGVPGVNTTVYDATWWNYNSGQPQMVNSGTINSSPEYDFVFDFNNSSTINNFKLYLVMAGGFKLFTTNALSLVQWTLPYTFNNTNVISVSEIDKINSKINLYPNPSSGTINIESEIENQNELSIFNITGQCIIKLDFNTKTSIDVNDLPNGVYTLQLKNNQGVFTSKVVLNK